MATTSRNVCSEITFSEPRVQKRQPFRKYNDRRKPKNIFTVENRQVNIPLDNLKNF